MRVKRRISDEHYCHCAVQHLSAVWRRESRQIAAQSRIAEISSLPSPPTRLACSTSLLDLLLPCCWPFHPPSRELLASTSSPIPLRTYLDAPISTRIRRCRLLVRRPAVGSVTAQGPRSQRGAHCSATGVSSNEAISSNPHRCSHQPWPAAAASQQIQDGVRPVLPVSTCPLMCP